jgi:hypothetical protein
MRWVTVLPDEVKTDVLVKTPFMKKIYALRSVYHGLMLAIPEYVYSSTQSVFETLIRKGLTSGTPYTPRFDFEKIREVYEVISQWNSLKLNGSLIYRGTSNVHYSSISEDYLTSAGVVGVINGEAKNLTYFSYFPASALIFAGMNYDPIIIVAEYDPDYCSPDNYFLIDQEISGLVNDKIYNYGAVRFLREMEIRCYKYPKSKIKYVLHKDDLKKLFKMVIPVYKQYMDDKDIKNIEEGLK